jgi:hypothetical protein
MDQNSDLIELLVAFNIAGVEYVLVGAYAFAFHARPRYTKDADIFVRPSSENASKIWKALHSFGAPLDGVQESDFAQLDTFFLMGRPPNQIDIITEIDGVSFDDAWQTRIPSTFGGVPVHYISRELLIANKKAAARPQDLVDVAYLEGQTT